MQRKEQAEGRSFPTPPGCLDEVWARICKKGIDDDQS